MPTVTTTVTSAAASGVTTTVTTTEATPDAGSISTGDAAIVEAVIAEWVAGTLVANKANFFSKDCTIDWGSKYTFVHATAFKAYSYDTIDEWLGNISDDFTFGAGMNWSFSNVEGGVLGEFTWDCTHNVTGKSPGIETRDNIRYSLKDGKITAAKLLYSDPAAIEEACTPEGAYAGVVAVTGAAGFIASETVKQLLNTGYHVRGTIRATEEHAHLYALAASLPGKIELFEADLNDPASFDECFQGCDLVIHLAAHVGVWEVDPYVEVVNPMVEGAKAVVAAVKRCGARRLVMTSSTFAITNWMSMNAKPKNGSLFTEEDWNEETSDELVRNAENKFDAYGAGKPLSEKAAWAKAEELGVDVVMIHPGIVFGPPVHKGGATISMFTDGLSEGGHPFIAGGVFGAIDVRDIAKACIAAAENPAAKGRYHISHAETYDQATYNKYMGDAFPKFGLKPFAAASKKLIDNRRAIELIGPLIPYEKMTVDTGRALLAKGMISYP